MFDDDKEQLDKTTDEIEQSQQNQESQYRFGPEHYKKYSGFYENNDNSETVNQTDDSEQQSNRYTYSDEGTYEAGYYKTQYNTVKNKKPKNKGMIIKIASIVLVFIVVGGMAFFGTTFVADKISTAISEKKSNDNDDNSSGKNVLTADETSSTDKTEGEVETAESNTDSSNTTAAGLLDVSDVVKEVIPSVVSISTISQSQYTDWFGNAQTSQSAGSGVVIKQTDNIIYIVTNNHVVDGASDLTVGFTDETTADAALVGTDSNNDLAVISVKKSDLSDDTLEAITTAKLGKSGEIKVGQETIAIGNALGYGQSVTTGVISAVDREVTIGNITNKLIQTDAAINPGNSGGALLNAEGEVIGINSAKYASTEVEGMGYAIPIDTASPVIDEIISTGNSVDSTTENDDATTQVTGNGAYLGIVGLDITQDMSAAYNLPESIYVTTVVQGGAAQQAGIAKGDLIVSFNGTGLTTMQELKSMLADCSPEDKVTVGVIKTSDGTYAQEELSVTLGSVSE